MALLYQLSYLGKTNYARTYERPDMALLYCQASEPRANVFIRSCE